jgi:hypothetical protein
MPNSKLDYECKYCNKILKDPILLPCGLFICNEHTQNITKLTCCKSCSSEHIVPRQGFNLNTELKTQIETLNAHLSEAELSYKHLFSQLQSQLAEMCDDFNVKCNEFEYFTHEHFAVLECQIELRRENLKSRVDDLSQELLDVVRERKKSFVSQSTNVNINDLKQSHVKEANEIDETFRQLDISLESLQTHEAHQRFQLKEIETRMNTFEKMKCQVERVEFWPNFTFNQCHFGLINTRLDYLVKIYDGVVVKFFDMEKNTCVKVLNLKDNDNEFFVRNFKVNKRVFLF